MDKDINYKEAYLLLFNCISELIEALVQVQIDAEMLCIADKAERKEMTTPGLADE